MVGGGLKILQHPIPKIGSFQRIGDGCADESEFVSDVISLAAKLAAVYFALAHELGWEQQRLQRELAAFTHEARAEGIALDATRAVVVG